MRSVFLAFGLALFALPANAQDAAPADVESIDAIITAVYDVISGPASEERDWDRFRSLFHAEARLIPTAPGQEGGTWTPIVLTVDGFAERSANAMRTAPLFQGKGFYEVESARRMERYEHVAHVWSTYESRLDPSEEPFARGINSFQLFWDGQRWWVLTVFWQQEGDASPIPGPYLPEGK